ncbi:hypothetical protein D1007_08508 [Hordeum vulgare]|nr:hypothetical protein D1007_08508 [Hordeum vulgare]
MWDRVDVGPELTCGTVQQRPQINPMVATRRHSVPSAHRSPCVAATICAAATSCAALAVLLHRYLLRPPPSCDAMGGAPATCSTRGVASFRAPDRSADRMELRFAFLVHIRRARYMLNAKNKKKFQGDPAFGECFEEGFDENVGQQPVAATDEENDGQQPVALDEDFDKVPNDDGQQPHDFDDDKKYPPNDDSSEAPNGDPSEAPNGDPSEAPNDDPSEAPNGDQPSVVASSARFEEDAQGTDNQEEKRISNEHKGHEEQSDGKKLKDQTEAPTLFMRNYETL